MAAYRRVDGFKSPVGWLPVHQDQLWAQRSVTRMEERYLYSTCWLVTLLGWHQWNFTNISWQGQTMADRAPRHPLMPLGVTTWHQKIV